MEAHFHEISSGHFPIFERIVDRGFHLDGGFFGGVNVGIIGVHGGKTFVFVCVGLVYQDCEDLSE